MLYNFAVFKSVNGLEMESLTVIIHNKATGYSETSVKRSPRYNEIFFCNPAIVKYMKKNLDITKPRCSEPMLPVLWPTIVIGRFHCSSF